MKRDILRIVREKIPLGSNAPRVVTLGPNERRPDVMFPTSHLPRGFSFPEGVRPVLLSGPNEYALPGCSIKVTSEGCEFAHETAGPLLRRTFTELTIPVSFYEEVDGKVVRFEVSVTDSQLRKSIKGSGLTNNPDRYIRGAYPVRR